jgi:hypothetical protein
MNKSRVPWSVLACFLFSIKGVCTMSLLSPKYQDLNIDEDLFLDRDEADRKEVMAKRTQWGSFEGAYLAREVSHLVESSSYLSFFSLTCCRR